MSEVERRWKNDKYPHSNWRCPAGSEAIGVYESGKFAFTSCHTIESIEAHPNFVETFDHLPKPDPLTALRTFVTDIDAAFRLTSGKDIQLAYQAARDRLRAAETNPKENA